VEAALLIADAGGLTQFPQLFEQTVFMQTTVFDLIASRQITFILDQADLPVMYGVFV
jgi:uncharacterized membrane protein YhdT